MATIPNYDVHNISNPDGTVHADQRIVMEQLTTQLKNSIGQNGFQIPGLTTDQINSLTTISLPGLMAFDKSLQVYKGLIFNGTNNVWKTFAFV